MKKRTTGGQTGGGRTSEREEEEKMQPSDIILPKPLTSSVVFFPSNLQPEGIVLFPACVVNELKSQYGRQHPHPVSLRDWH